MAGCKTNFLCTLLQALPFPLPVISALSESLAQAEESEIKLFSAIAFNSFQARLIFKSTLHCNNNHFCHLWISYISFPSTLQLPLTKKYSWYHLDKNVTLKNTRKGPHESILHLYVWFTTKQYYTPVNVNLEGVGRQRLGIWQRKSARREDFWSSPSLGGWEFEFPLITDTILD